MAIYDFSKVAKEELKMSSLEQKRFEEKEAYAAVDVQDPNPEKRTRDRIFSALAARLFFLLLFLADVVWVCYALLQLLFASLGFSLLGGKAGYFKELMHKGWITLRRSLVCGVSLMIALFSPAFGIMIACTYFLMYDKTGIEEVVPSSLQAQFKEFLPKE